MTWRIAVSISWILLVGCIEPGDEPPEVGSEQAEIRGGTVAGVGLYEAVVRVGTCSGTLISDDTVLTAAHCVCTQACGSCSSRSSVTFTDVRPVGSSMRQDVTIAGDVLVHPHFCPSGAYKKQDLALIKLDQRASDEVQVAPIYAEPPDDPTGPGDLVVLIGYGGTNVGSTNNCNNAALGTKRYGTTVVDDIQTWNDPADGAHLHIVDTAVGSCPGDSGGPALDARGRVVGVASTGDRVDESWYVKTAEAWDWIADNGCPDFDPEHPDASFCSNPLCPCASAEGDCDASSQCLPGDLCVNNVGVASGLPASYDVCWDPAHLATVYDGSGYTGARQSFPIGDWGAASMNQVGNDRVSSIDVAPGYSARLCSENGGWGNCQDFAGRSSLSGSPLDNNSSNIRVRPGVTVYDYYGFGGTSQTFTAGSYGAAELDVIGNDDVSSLIAAPGIQVRLCSANGAWGDCQEYSGRVTNVGSLLDQRTSHIQVRAGVTVYRGVDYTGVEQSFASGTYGAAALTTIGNDTIRSLVVAPGMSARVCSENGGWGDCETFTGWVPYVGRTLDRRISYIEVARSLSSIPPIGRR